MKKLLFFVFCIGIFTPSVAFAASDQAEMAPVEDVKPFTFINSDLSAPLEFYKAQVREIVSFGENENVDGTKSPYQILKIVLLEGPDSGKEFTVEYGTSFSLLESQKVHQNEIVVVNKVMNDGKTTYYLTDTYRISPLIWMTAVFLLLVLFFGAWHGIRSLFGLVFTGLVVFLFMIPRILDGQNPLFVSLIAAFLIATISLYLAHGFHKRITLALISTYITLTLSIFLSLLFVSLAKLSGAGSEDAYSLQLGFGHAINLRGLLLGGIIIGTLGVLDDITTGQVAAVDEIHKANPRLGFFDLYRRGISVGREHIASLVNTLVLAYAGASFPLLLLFSTDTQSPLWVTLNSEAMSEEIVRTLVGSITLVFAVPISTFLAAYFLRKRTLVSTLQ